MDLYELNPKNLFPQVEDYDYQKAKAHAEKVDQFLGYNIEDVEKKIAARFLSSYRDVNHLSPTQLWINLEPAILQTPYIEIRNMLDSIPQHCAKNKVIDLGCAYARMAHVVHKHYPNSLFMGFETVLERAQEAQRVINSLQMKQTQILCQDLMAPDFQVPQADVFFIYDYGSHEAITKTLNELKSHATAKSMTVIARGRLSRHLILKDHAWLSGVNPPLHFQNYSLFFS